MRIKKISQNLLPFHRLLFCNSLQGHINQFTLAHTHTRPARSKNERLYYARSLPIAGRNKVVKAVEGVNSKRLVVAVYRLKWFYGSSACTQIRFCHFHSEWWSFVLASPGATSICFLDILFSSSATIAVFRSRVWIANNCSRDYTTAIRATHPCLFMELNESAAVLSAMPSKWILISSETKLVSL